MPWPALRDRISRFTLLGGCCLALGGSACSRNEEVARAHSSPLLALPAIKATSPFAIAPQVLNPIGGTPWDWASDGSNFLLVGDGQALLIDASGKLLNKTTLGVGMSGGQASVEFVGTHYVVAFTNGSPSPIFAVRLGLDGSLLDAVPVMIAGVPGGMHPTLACGSTQCYLAWRGDASNEAFFGKRLTFDLGVIGSESTRLSSTSLDWSRPSLAARGDHFVFAFASLSDIIFREIAETGEVDAYGAVTLSGTQLDPLLACTSTSCLLTYRDTTKVSGNLLTSGGVLGSRLSLASETSIASHSLLFDGSNYALAWLSGDAAYARRLDLAGAGLGSPRVSVPGSNLMANATALLSSKQSRVFWPAMEFTRLERVSLSPLDAQPWYILEASSIRNPGGCAPDLPNQAALRISERCEAA